MATFNRTETVARRHKLSPLGHLPYLLVFIGLITGVTWFFVTQGNDDPVVNLEIYEQPAVEPIYVDVPAAEKPISKAVVVEKNVAVEQVELDPFAISFPVLDVDWIKVEDLDSIPSLALDAPSYTYTGGSSPETREWAAQFFPKLHNLQFAGTHPVGLQLHEDGGAIAVFMNIIVSSDRINGQRRSKYQTWLIVSEDNGKSWMQLTSYPVPPDAVENEPIGRLRMKETTNSIIIYIKPSGFEPWMMTTIKKPLN